MERYSKVCVILVFILLTILVFISVGIAYAKTIYVPDNYAKIQWAVNNASTGDTIIVRDGTYVENVNVSKQLTIQSENGSVYTTVQAKNSSDHVFKVTTNYVNISGFTVEEPRWEPWSPATGIYLNNANHCNISINNISNNQDGIKLLRSSNNVILNNHLYNSDNGVLLDFSSNNIISNNSMLGINNGIHLKKSPNNKIADNKVLLGYWFGYGKAGIHLEKSSDNKIVNNNLSSNYCPGLWRYGSEEIGIYLSSSSNNEITNNSFKSDGIFISGTKVFHYNSHIIENNAVNGKPIYYYKNTNGIRVPEDAGEVILANCSNMTVENVNVSSSSVGVEIVYTEYSLISNAKASNQNYYAIYLYNSSNITVSHIEANGNFNGIYIENSQNNKIINNEILYNGGRRSQEGGICLKSSSNNKITNNNISFNKGTGFYLDHSSHNKIYLNNFIDNINNVYSNSSNIWNSTLKITYTYKGKTCTNYLGNYWSDYTGSDTDGIWDTAYSIDSDKDSYPLIGRFENYLVETPASSPPGFEAVFAIAGLLAVAYLLRRKG